MRRIFALVIVLWVAFWNLEPLLGVARDGAVHHESTVEAVRHADAGSGDHGHEDPGADDHDHAPGHTHGTGADHCTHHHGTAVPTTLQLVLFGSEIKLVDSESFHVTSSYARHLFRPPALA